jgi:hypothetical protein
VWVEGLRAEAVQVYDDERGISSLRIEGAPTPLLAAAFEHDIQTPSTATIVYNRLAAVAAGDDIERIFSGNSCTVTITTDHVAIVNDLLVNEEPLEMSIDQYRILLDAWYSHLPAA